jgi:hypothetical protein
MFWHSNDMLYICVNTCVALCICECMKVFRALGDGCTTNNPPYAQYLRYVEDANTMVSRTALCILFAMALNCHWILEQPLSSIMRCHPRMSQILTLSATTGIPGVQEVTTWMGMYGAPSPKPTILMGTPSWLESLKRTWRKSQVIIDNSVC